MSEFKLESSIQLPIRKLKAAISYNEVEKPSGIAYILLVLIDEYSSISITWGSLLESIGVPQNLIEVFGEEFSRLAAEGVVSYRYGYVDASFYEKPVRDYYFTDKGRTLFKNGYIPKGETNLRHQDVYYEIAKASFTLEPDPNLETRPIKGSALNADYVASFPVAKDLDEFVLSRKHQEIGLKKEEEIIEIKEETEEREAFYGKYPATIELDGDSYSISMNSSSLNAFVKEHYQASFITDSLRFKNKFAFVSPHAEGMRFSDFAPEKVEAINYPGEIAFILRKNYAFLLTKEEMPSATKLKFIDAGILALLASYAEAVYLDEAHKGHMVVPAVYSFDNPSIGAVQINLVATVTVSEEKASGIVKAIIKNKLSGSFSLEKAQRLVMAVALIKDYEAGIAAFDSYLGTDAGENLNLLSSIRNVIGNKDGWKDAFAQRTKANLDDYMDGVSKDNLKERLSVARWACQYLGIPNGEIIATILSKFEDKGIAVYDALRDSFKAEEILPYLNPFEDIVSGKKGTSQENIDLAEFLALKSKLLEMAKTEDFNQEEFLNGFHKLQSLEKRIVMFRPFNGEAFVEFNRSVETIREAADYANDVKNAEKNIAKLTLEIVQKEIDGGHYRAALADLSAKAEHALRELSYQGTFAEMLYAAKQEKVFDKDIKNALYEMKDARNSVLHPDDREEVQLTAENLRRWAEAVFQIKKGD